MRILVRLCVMLASGVSPVVAIAASNEHKTYLLIKSIVIEMGNDQPKYRAGKEFKQLPLFDCDRPFIETPRVEGNMADVAYEVTNAQDMLELNGYPPEVWRQELRKFEETAVARIHKGSPILEKMRMDLVKRINDAVKKRKLKLRKFEFEACGGGPLSLTASIKPNEAEVFAIPKVFYRYCEKKGVDPLDRDQCDYWLPTIRNGDSVEMGGVYVYRVVFDGQETKPKTIDSDRYFEIGTVEFKR